MKKILALLLVSMFASVAKAEQIPDGCYVADYYRTDPCYNSPSALFEWTAFTDRSIGVAKYGPVVETIIFRSSSFENSLNSCNSSYNNLLADRNSISAQLGSCNSNYNNLLADRNSIAAQQSTCVTDYNNLVAPYNKNLALIKKLRKACGSKCKKIK